MLSYASKIVVNNLSRFTCLVYGVSDSPSSVTEERAKAQDPAKVGFLFHVYQESVPSPEIAINDCQQDETMIKSPAYCKFEGG